MPITSRDDFDDFGGDEDDEDVNREIDEDPSDADLERLDHESAFCPDCGAKIWDACEVCPSCYAYLGGNTSHRSKLQNWVNAKVIIVIVVLLLIALLWWIL